MRIGAIIIKVIVFILFIVGLGYAMVIVSALIAIYYCMVIGWCLYYFFVSMASVLPWDSCDNSWNTCACRIMSQNKTLIEQWNGAFPHCGKNNHWFLVVFFPTFLLGF